VILRKTLRNIPISSRMMSSSKIKS
ncbi:hypothetical protein GWI33_009394, partial [Rhynchophorus ferrugineus]